MQPSPSRAASWFMRATKRVDAAGDVLGERDRGVVAGRQQQAVEHALERHAASERQHADLRAGHVDGLPRDEHARIGRGGLDGHERGHHLGEARDRQPRVGVALPQHLAGREVEQQPGARGVREGEVDRVLLRRCEIPLSASAGLPSGRPAGERDVTAAGAGPDAAWVRGASARVRRVGPSRWRAPSRRAARRAARARARRGASRRLRLRRAASARRLRLWPGVRNGEVLMLGEDCAARRRSRRRCRSTAARG